MNYEQRHYDNLNSLQKLDEFSNQAKFLCKNNIKTEQELLDYEKLAYEKINPLKSKRENLWRKHKKAKTDDEKKNIENQIVEISKKITPLAEEIRHCNNIRLRLEKIKEQKEKRTCKTKRNLKRIMRWADKGTVF